MGREQIFGKPKSWFSSNGGTPFNMYTSGLVVRGFTVGFGGHLHFVGAHFGAEPASFPMPTPSPFPVPSPSPWP